MKGKRKGRERAGVERKPGRPERTSWLLALTQWPELAGSSPEAGRAPAARGARGPLGMPGSELGLQVGQTIEKLG